MIPETELYKKASEIFQCPACCHFIAVLGDNKEEFLPDLERKSREEILALRLQGRLPMLGKTV